MAQTTRSSYGGLLTMPQAGLAQPDLAGAYRQGFGDAFTEELKRAAYLEQPKRKPAGGSSIGLAPPATYGVEKQLDAAGLRLGKEYSPTPDLPPLGSLSAPTPSAAAPDVRIGLGVENVAPVPYLQPLYDMGVDPRELHQIIAGESKWDPAAKGKGTSTASGLFQFIEDAAKDLGTKPEDIRAMSEEEQVALYVRYLKRWGWTPDIPLGLMQAAPAKARELSGRPDSTVVYEVGSPGWNKNKPWRSDGGKGPITKGSIRQYYARQSARPPAFQDGGMADQSAISGGAGDAELGGGEGTDTLTPNEQRRAARSAAYAARSAEPSPPVQQRPRGQMSRGQRPRLSDPGIPESSPYRAGVVTPEDFQFGMGAYEPPQLPTPEAPQMAGFDFSRRAQALQEKEAYMQRAMQLAGIDAYLSGNPSQLRALQAEYAQLGNERTLVAGVNALQAATMGDINPLRQFLADQYGTGDVQIYPMADGTLEIEVNGQSLGRTTLADIRQQLLAELDPATQRQMAVQSDRMWEVALLGIQERLKAQGRPADIKVLSKPDVAMDQPGLFYVGSELFEMPVIRTTIGGEETVTLGEPVSRGTFQRTQ